MSAVKIPYRRPVRSGNNSTAGEKVAENIRAGITQFFGGRRVVVIVGILLGLAAVTIGVLWYVNIYSSPTRIFWDMVGNNLSTNSVTTENTQQGPASSNQTTTQLAFSPNPIVRNIQEVNTTSLRSNTKVKIESIGTPNDTFQHYIWINQQPAKGKTKPDYSKVYHLWIKNGGNGLSNNATLFNDAIFGSFLFGNLPQDQKTTLMGYLRGSYTVDFNNVVRQKNHGRKTFTYSVALSLKDYANAAHYYAQKLGLAEANNINPANYQASDKVSLSVNIDVLSRQLKQVTYKSSNTSENYSNYGILASFKPPKNTVSYDLLQKAVTQAANGAK